MCVGVWKDIYVEPIEGDDDKGQRMWIVVQILIAFVSDINKDPCLMPICSFAIQQFSFCLRSCLIVIYSYDVRYILTVFPLVTS